MYGNIAEKLGRDKSAITCLLVKQVERRPQGQEEAHTFCKFGHSDKGIHVETFHPLRGLCAGGAIYVHRLWEKPRLTNADVKVCLAFACKRKHKSEHWWHTHFLDAAIGGAFSKQTWSREEILRVFLSIFLTCTGTGQS